MTAIIHAPVTIHLPTNTIRPTIMMPQEITGKELPGKGQGKVRKRIGYNAKIDWGKTDIYNSARHEATINGKGKARNNGKKHQLYYTCIMNREDAFVRSARIELDNDGHDTGNGGTDWNREAARACHERIRQKAQRNIHQQFSLEFTGQRLTTPAERRRHVTGEARVKVSGAVEKSPMTARHTSIRCAWTAPATVGPDLFRQRTAAAIMRKPNGSAKGT